MNKVETALVEFTVGALDTVKDISKALTDPDFMRRQAGKMIVDASKVLGAVGHSIELGEADNETIKTAEDNIQQIQQLILDTALIFSDGDIINSTVASILKEEVIEKEKEDDEGDNPETC